MNIRNIIIVFFAVVLCSCTSEYRKLQMAGNPDEKYEAAKVFFQEKKYAKASTLFEDIVSLYRGTKKAEEVLFLLSESYMHQKDYYSASDYYKTYIRNYPRGKYSDVARFKVGYCFYLDSPDARLDQKATHNAIEAFTEYIDMYPNATNVNEARTYLFEMYDKLSYKSYLNARLYYNLGLYGGNNYKSAVVIAEDALRSFPETSYRENFLFVILQSKYKEATLSTSEKQRERYSEVVDEYYRYTNEYSDGKNIKEANRILKAAKQVIK